MKIAFKLRALKEPIAICRLPQTVELTIPRMTSSQYFSVTRTEDEFSIACSEALVPENARDVNPGWLAIRIEGQVNFAMVGVNARLTKPLADAGVCIFAMSTYDTDYILVKQDNFHLARKTLMDCGHVFIDS
jgi:hypothetical protein